MARKPPPSPIGPHAGRALADLITRVTKDVRSAMAPIEAEQRRRTTEAMMDDWEGEIGRFVGLVLDPLRDLEDKPDWLVEMLDRADAPTHQTDFILSLVVGIAGAFTLITTGGSIVWRNTINDIYKANRYFPLSPADAADAVIRSLMSKDEADGWAAQSGINPHAFGYMVDLTGEPPPLDEMRTLLAQGRISEADFERILRYSRVRDEWLGDYIKAHNKPLSAADIVEGFIKGQLSEGDAAQRYGIGGGMPDEFALAAAIAGNPIGVEQALSLLNHGLINEDQARNVIKHSRINPMFEDMALLTRFHYLTAFQIERMLTQGTVTPEDASRWLIEDGYPADQVAGLVKGATTTKASKPKQVAETLVLDNYEAGFITGAQAVAQLGNLGYSPEEAGIIIESYDARRVLTLRNQGVAAVGKGFKAGIVDRSTASGDLDALGVSATLRDHYLALWEVERKTEFKTFTKAEIGSMFKKGIVTADWAVKQWLAIGYNSAQAQMLLYEYGQPTPNNKPVA